jgi:hypothetical protein
MCLVFMKCFKYKENWALSEASCEAVCDLPSSIIVIPSALSKTASAVRDRSEERFAFRGLSLGLPELLVNP